MKHGHSAPQICPTQPSVCPPKLELKLPTGFLDLLGSRQRCFKGPRFQHLLRNKVPICDSGIHLAGTGKGAAICLPYPSPSSSQSWEGGGGRGGAGSGGDTALPSDKALVWGGSSLAWIGDWASWRGNLSPKAQGTALLK